jgi:hypothetical protein
MFVNLGPDLNQVSKNQESFSKQSYFMIFFLILD